MNEKSPPLLSQLPARLMPEKVAEILGFSPCEISLLMKLGLLKPLGKPAPNAHKYFCATEIIELSHDRESTRPPAPSANIGGRRIDGKKGKSLLHHRHEGEDGSVAPKCGGNCSPSGNNRLVYRRDDTVGENLIPGHHCADFA
jgi:hypothetical protein